MVAFKMLVKFHIKRLVSLLLMVGILSCVLPSFSFAQDTEVVASGVLTPDDIIKQQRPVIDDLKKQLQAAQKQYETDQNDEHALSKVRTTSQTINSSIIDAALVFRAPLNDINLRLDQLGEPQDGVTEPKAMSDERNKLRQQKAQINAMVGELEDASVDSSRLFERTIVQARELFSRALTQRVNFDAALGNQISQSAKEASQDISSLFYSWWQFIYHFKMLEFLSSLLVPLLFALVLSFFAHKIIDRSRENANVDDKEISYLKRLSFAFVSTLLPSIVCVIFVHLTLFMLNYFDLVWAELLPVFKALGAELILVFFIARMSFVIFSPKIPEMQLLNIAPKPAAILIVFLTLLALVMGADYFLNTVYRAVSAPLTLTVAKSFISVILVGLIVLAISFVRPNIKQGEKKASPWPLYIRIPLIVLGVAPIATAALGYIGLARFISQQIVVSGAFLVLLYLGIQTARATAAEGAFVQTAIGRRLENQFHFDDGTMDQLGLFAGVLINLLVIFVCVPPIIMQLGFSSADIYSMFVHLMTGFQIGNVSISLVAILTGIAFFILSWFLIRWFISWLDGTVMARGRVDSGVRNSIRTVFGYCGVALSALIGLSAAGFNLSSLALIAGGLSLGIGFGLQNIVQNFVSGLILLAERPFKVGDYVETGTASGIVKRISVRATEVETFKRQTIIVPNSSLINNNVGNWTHRNKIGRVDIPITVPAMSDPQHIMDVLMEIAGSAEGILKNPAPWVSFANFDSNVLTFTLCVYVPDITTTTAVTNAIRIKTYDRFSEEGIT